MRLIMSAIKKKKGSMDILPFPIYILHRSEVSSWQTKRRHENNGLRLQQFFRNQKYTCGRIG